MVDVTESVRREIQARKSSGSNLSRRAVLAGAWGLGGSLALGGAFFAGRSSVETQRVVRESAGGSVVQVGESVSGKDSLTDRRDAVESLRSLLSLMKTTSGQYADRMRAIGDKDFTEYFLGPPLICDQLIKRNKQA